MADIAASVLTRLKNKAQSSGRSYQLCLQLFCQEEFLRRLEKSKYAENFVLKGGLFIYSLTEFDSRVTVDVDFLLRQIPNTPEQLRVVLEEIIAAPTENEFVTFEITDVAPIAVANTYSLETTIAEKLDAILDLMEFSSRMKDYYDIYYLANKFDFDGATLTKALKKTFENRGHAFTIEQFEQVMAFAENDAMQKKWKAFCRKIDTKTDDFNAVLKTIKEFLIEPFMAVMSEKGFAKKWSGRNNIWREN